MLSVYTLEQSEHWDIIVRSFFNYDAYYLSGYVKAFQIHGDGEPILFFYETDGLRGFNVVMKRDIAKDIHFVGKLPNNTYFDFATPYGYGGWLIEGNGDRKQLFEAYENWCQKHNIVSEFVRFHPVLKNHLDSVTNYEVIHLGETIAMDLSSPEVIWENITSKNRNVIRKAQKNGVYIRRGDSLQLYESFRKIYNSTMDKDKANTYYYFSMDFYESLVKDLPYNAQVFYAVKDNEVIAASIILAANGHLNYHLSGSKLEFQKFAPTNLLLYEAALWGFANGCRVFHLGGGVGAKDDSLYAFKKAFFRGEPLQYCVGRKIIMPEEYAKLCSLREVNSEQNFFPLYRA